MPRRARHFFDDPSFVITTSFDRTRPRVWGDRKADAVYLNLTDAAILESEEVADGTVVDYDAEGRIVGVEILDASKRTGDPEALKEMSFELPGIA